MKITSAFRRTVSSGLLTAGLVYPACAAVCPKGIGGCPTPGRCFLFTDADANSFCDYTARTGAPATIQTTVQPSALPSPDPAVVSATASPVPLPETTTILQNVSQGGFSDAVDLSAPFLAGIALFLVFTGILFLLAMRGRPGIPAGQTREALALSAFFGLGISLIITFFLAGGTLAGTTCALIWMGVGTLLAAYLWYSGVTTRKVVLGAAALGALAGFVFLAPIMPLELGGIVNVITGVSVLTPGVIVIIALILLAMVTGRAFCGNVCPVGSLQELAYAVPVQKHVIRNRGILEIVRLAVFFASVISAMYLVDLMAVTGLYDLFSLTVSSGLFTAASLILLSLFLYRPICRILCPFGLLFSIPSKFSLYRLRRTDHCIGCKKCEKECPAGTAGAEDPKRECYLCARCTDVCPVQGALEYHR